MLHDPFPSQGDDGQEPGGSVPPPAAGDGPQDPGEAKQDTHVRRFREASGNAGMIARELPGDEALASWQHVEQRAVLHRLHVTQAPEGCDYDFL